MGAGAKGSGVPSSWKGQLSQSFRGNLALLAGGGAAGEGVLSEPGRPGSGGAGRSRRGGSARRAHSRCRRAHPHPTRWRANPPAWRIRGCLRGPGPRVAGSPANRAGPGLLPSLLRGLFAGPLRALGPGRGRLRICRGRLRAARRWRHLHAPACGGGRRGSSA